MRNVFEAILECGHDEDFNPAENDEFFRTDAPAGSKAKIDVLAERGGFGRPDVFQAVSDQPENQPKSPRTACGGLRCPCHSMISHWGITLRTVDSRGFAGTRPAGIPRTQCGGFSAES